MITISVFGNEVDSLDNPAITLVPLLKQRFPNIKFLIQDPTESIEPAGDPWIILDAALGISHVRLIESLDDLELVKGSSVHDFDVYMELRLKAKLNPLPTLKIILIPQDDELEHSANHVFEILTKILKFA